MIQIATVTSVLNDGNAIVAVKRETACGMSCSECGAGCYGETPMVTVRARNTINASEGDYVSVEASTQEIMLIAALVYLLPVVLFFLGYGLGMLFSGNNPVGLLSGAGGFLLGIALTILYGRRKKGKIMYKIIEILPKDLYDK